MNPSGEKPVYGLNSWEKDVALGHFTFLSLGLHFENMVSPKNTSTQPDNKSGLSRNAESPEDAFLCVRGIQECKVTDARTLTVLLKMRAYICQGVKW